MLLLPVPLLLQLQLQLLLPLKLLLSCVLGRVGIRRQLGASLERFRDKKVYETGCATLRDPSEQVEIRIWCSKKIFHDLIGPQVNGQGPTPPAFSSSPLTPLVSSLSFSFYLGLFSFSSLLPPILPFIGGPA